MRVGVYFPRPRYLASLLLVCLHAKSLTNRFTNNCREQNLSSINANLLQPPVNPVANIPKSKPFSNPNNRLPHVATFKRQLTVHCYRRRRLLRCGRPPHAPRARSLTSPLCYLLLSPFHLLSPQAVGNVFLAGRLFTTPSTDKRHHLPTTRLGKFAF